MSQVKCKQSFKVLIGVAFITGLLFIINYVLGEITNYFFLGVLFGVVLGLVSCFFLVRTYDIINGRPKNSNSLLVNSNGGIGVIFGIIMANVITSYFGNDVRNFTMGLSSIWLLAVVSFITFYRCKNELKSNNND